MDVVPRSLRSQLAVFVVAAFWYFCSLAGELDQLLGRARFFLLWFLVEALLLFGVMLRTSGPFQRKITLAITLMSAPVCQVVILLILRPRWTFDVALGTIGPALFLVMGLRPSSLPRRMPATS
jgi:hypothetical protein